MSAAGTSREAVAGTVMLSEVAHGAQADSTVPAHALVAAAEPPAWDREVEEALVVEAVVPGAAVEGADRFGECKKCDRRSRL